MHRGAAQESEPLPAKRSGQMDGWMGSGAGAALGVEETRKQRNQPADRKTCGSQPAVNPLLRRPTADGIAVSGVPSPPPPVRPLNPATRLGLAATAASAAQGLWASSLKNTMLVLVLVLGTGVPPPRPTIAWQVSM